MQIHGPSHIHGAHGIQGPNQQPRSPRVDTQQPAQPSRVSDQLEISEAAEAAVQSLELANQSPDSGGIRNDLVARIRAELANGTYETPEKLDAAIDRFLDDFA